MSLRIAINGAAGRMGQRLVALATADADLEVAAAIECPGHPQLGQDAGVLASTGAIDVPLGTTLGDAAQVAIDFSLPEGAETILAACRREKIPLVLATTGLDERATAAVHDATAEIPVLWAPSMSTAVNLAMKSVQLIGKALKDVPGGADVEVIERHHRFKQDAPSGTALRFGQLIADAMGQDRHVHGREGDTGQRPHDEIGYHALRVGDNTGEHTIVFGMLGETLELTVRSSNRDCYAYGALAAAKFIADKPPGLYTMDDVLGL
jgi:4-hydroxy-tetrahydrodipicolinate reductase